MASPFSEVASLRDGKPSLNLSIDYGLDIRRAAIKREFAGFPGTDPSDPTPVVRDLVYSGVRHTITPKLELGVFTDLSISVALPIVISDSRDIEFDQRDTPCAFTGPDATCIDAGNSTTVLDGLLPANGFDANDPTTGFVGGRRIFRGPNRSGLDQIQLGVAWAPMNQATDDTKPTWKLGAELRLAIGKPMKFSRRNPSSETGVGNGLHEVRLWTTMAKRLGWAEPYMSLWWQAPFATQKDSQWLEPGFGQRRTEAQQSAGTRFGFEAIAWEKPAENLRLSFDMSARLEAKFEGRAYTEMWEIFQYAGDASVDAADRGPLVLDSDPTQDGVQLLSHPGVSNVENYMRFGGRFGANAVLGDKVRFGLSLEFARDQSHVASFADAGTDKPTCSGGQVPPTCEVSSNDVVNPGTDEVNPLSVPLIDTVGRRYRIDEATNFIFLLEAQILF